MTDPCLTYFIFHTQRQCRDSFLLVINHLGQKTFDAHQFGDNLFLKLRVKAGAAWFGQGGAFSQGQDTILENSSITKPE